MADHLAGQDVSLKDLCLVQRPGEAIHQEQITAAPDHSILQQCNGHLHKPMLS